MVKQAMVYYGVHLPSVKILATNNKVNKASVLMFYINCLFNLIFVQRECRKFRGHKKETISFNFCPSPSKSCYLSIEP